MKMVFHYYSGEEVREGDIVRTGQGNTGIVEKVFHPNTVAAEQHDCLDTGGIFICENWDGKDSYILLTPPDGIYWEDLVLVNRP